jgi:molecular chaperone GrpE
MAKKNEKEEELSNDKQSNSTLEMEDNTESIENIDGDAEHHENIGLPTPTCEEELELLKDKNLRLYSEFENFRRRSAKERIELIQNAGQEIISALLPILDDFDRAVIAGEESKDIQAIKEGMELIHNKIYSLLSAKGLKPMEAQGQDFDSDNFEAIAKIPAPSEDLKGKVLDVVEKGYYLNNKIIRHAKVVVGE